MLIAQITNPVPVDYRAAFPNVSFPPGGPTDEFLAEQGYAKVNMFREHDRATQKLAAAQPYYEAPWVYTVTVEPLTQEELAALDEAKRANNEARAKQELEASDWADLASVRDTNNTPHLTNTAAFDAYRLALRAIVINPPVDVAEWPARPAAVWST